MYVLVKFTISKKEQQHFNVLECFDSKLNVAQRLFELVKNDPNFRVIGGSDDEPVHMKNLSRVTDLMENEYIVIDDEFYVHTDAELDKFDMRTTMDGCPIFMCDMGYAIYKRILHA